MDNTQTQMKLTPLMEAAIAITRNNIGSYAGENEARLFDGIIDAFKSEIPQPIKLDLAHSQIIDYSPDDDSLAVYKAMLMALMQEELDNDPFCDAGTPHTGIQELLKRLGYAEARGDRLEQERDKLQAELSIAKLRADSIIQSQLEEHGYINAPGSHDVNFPVATPEPDAGREVQEAKAPAPAVKKVDGRKKPAEDAHLSELAKLFNQKGVPGLGDLKAHLPQVARHLFGDGITSTVTIAKQIGISMSDAAALVKVAQACKEASEGVDSERFMAAISEVSA